MSKKDWKKQFYRVKQLAGQNLGRAARSEVLTEDLQMLEKRVDLVKQVCHILVKKLQTCSQSQSGDFERRLKKTPEAGLYHSMIESATLLGNDTLLGPIIKLCGEAQGNLAHSLVNYEIAVEAKVTSPIQQLLENEIPTIQKLRKQLSRLTLDMDSVRTRYQAAVRQTQGSGSQGASAAKVDGIRDELDEACTKVQQCRDQLATEMYNFVARESEYSELLIELVREQTEYHRQALEALDNMLPEMTEQLEQYCQMPVYGLALEEHLRRSSRDIASVLEECICTLLHIGMEEEGLFRIAGSASRLKKLKAALNSGMVDMSDYIMDIPCVASALKQYLRELPEPLMTHALYSEWMQAAYLAPEERVNVFRQVLEKMPKANYNNLRYLIKFLVKLSEKSDINKMSASNIGIVIGPNLLWPPGDNSPSVVSSGTQASIVETLILNADTLFPGEEDFMCGGCNDSPKTTPPSTLNSAPAEGDTELTTITEPLMAALTSSCSPIPPGEGYNPFYEGSNNPARSPRTNRHGVKKPAPMPPGVTPEKSPAATDSVPHSSVSSEDALSLERSPLEKPPLPERPNAPPPAPPEKPSLTKVDSMNRPANGVSSPRPDRPRGPPPERPPGPLPERPHDRPMVAPPDRPHERLPSVTSEQATGGQRSSKPPPPRPLPPPRSAHKDTPKVTPGGSTTNETGPPVPERKESNERSSPVPEETHL